MFTLELADESALVVMLASEVARVIATVFEDGVELASPFVIDDPITSALALAAV